MKLKIDSGMSLLEILVVVAIFAILAILTTQAVILTIRGSKKTESLVRVRENLNYSMGIIERQIRNSDSVTDCTNEDTTSITFTDQDGNPSKLSCINVVPDSNDGYIASGSASLRLTSDTVNVTSCSFYCDDSSTNSPPSVSVYLEAQDKATSGIQGSKVSVSNRIYLRSY